MKGYIISGKLVYKYNLPAKGIKYSTPLQGVTDL
jgi:hypothetical protein